jgi:hypothetical protein
MNTATWVGAGSVSMTMLAYVAAMMLNNKKLMQHPNQLVFLMCLAEASACWHATIQVIGVNKIICYFKMNEALSYFLMDNKTLDETFTLLSGTNLYLMQVSQFLSLALNFCMCLEVIKNLRDPFYPA